MAVRVRSGSRATPSSQRRSRSRRSFEPCPPSKKDVATGRKRILQLAQPKEYRSVWITEVGPRVMWGTQETLWPVTDGALGANASGRVSQLARPKHNFQEGPKLNRPEYMFSCGRPSVIWRVNPAAVKAEATEGVMLLAKAKRAPREFVEDRPHFVFSCGRSSPIWKVPPGARNCPERVRTEDLARPKSVHPSYQPERQVQTIIPQAALSAQASTRLETLSVPKNRNDGPYRDSQWQVTIPALKATPSNRIQELSKPKGHAQGYVQNKDVIPPVRQSALQAKATERINELSAPIVRATMDHVQFDPTAFTVKSAALKGRCTIRMDELARPVLRS